MPLLLGAGEGIDNADINNDELINIIDIVQLIGIILYLAIYI